MRALWRNTDSRSRDPPFAVKSTYFTPLANCNKNLVIPCVLGVKAALNPPRIHEDAKNTSEPGVVKNASQFMRLLTLSETVENSIRVNSWNSWRFLLATNFTNFTKTITAIWMPSVRNTNFQSLTSGLLTHT